MPKVLIRALRALSVSAGLAAAISPAALTAQNLFAPAITVNGDAITGYELEQRARLLQILNAPGDTAELARDGLGLGPLRHRATGPPTHLGFSSPGSPLLH